MNKLEFTVNKKSDKGQIRYKVNLNEDESFTIEILEKSASGTYESGPLSLSEAREMAKGKSRNNNNKAFWKSILDDLNLNQKE